MYYWNLLWSAFVVLASIFAALMSAPSPLTFGQSGPGSALGGLEMPPLETPDDERPAKRMRLDSGAGVSGEGAPCAFASGW